MKLSKKFLEDLHKIGEDAFIEKNQWIGKLVPDIIIDNLKKRGISQGDLEGVVCLSVEEAKYALKVVRFAITTCEAVNEHKDKLWNFASLLHRRIEKAEGKR